MRIQELGFLTGYTQKQGAGPVLRPLHEGFSPAFGDLLANTEYRPGVGKTVLEGVAKGVPGNPTKMNAYKDQVSNQFVAKPHDFLQMLKWWRRNPKSPYGWTSPVRKSAFKSISSEMVPRMLKHLQENPDYLSAIKPYAPPVPQASPRLPVDVVDEDLHVEQEK